MSLGGHCIEVDSTVIESIILELLESLTPINAISYVMILDPLAEGCVIEVGSSACHHIWHRVERIKIKKFNNGVR